MKLKFNFLRVTFFTTNIGRQWKAPHSCNICQRCLVRLDEAADAAESRQVGLHLCDYCMALLLYSYLMLFVCICFYIYIYVCEYISFVSFMNL